MEVVKGGERLYCVREATFGLPLCPRTRLDSRGASGKFGPESRGLPALVPQVRRTTAGDNRRKIKVLTCASAVSPERWFQNIIIQRPTKPLLSQPRHCNTLRNA